MKTDQSAAALRYINQHGSVSKSADPGGPTSAPAPPATAGLIEIVSYEELGKNAKICAVTVYHFLVQHVDGRALGVVHLVEPPNGLEVWRQLCKEYEPDIGGRLASALRSILRPDWWNDSEDFRKCLITWDNQVLAYERASGEALAQGIKAAIVMEYTIRLPR